MGKRLDTGKAFEVGYKKPPRDNQFQKGRSGNPKGRPKHKLNHKTVLDRELSRVVHVTEGGQRRTLTMMEVLARKMVHAAASGNPKMLELLHKYGLSQENPEAFVVEDDDLAIFEAVLKKATKK